MDGNQGPEVVPAGHGDRQLRATVAALAARSWPACPAPDSAAALIDQIRDLEDLKSAMAARQARLAVAFDLLQRREQAAAGIPAEKLGAGIGAQIALARRESPAKGGRLLGLAKALVTEMPHTLAALETGQLNEWRATLLVRETACLTAADRAAVDERTRRPTPGPSPAPVTGAWWPRPGPPRTGWTPAPSPNAPRTPPPSGTSASARPRTPCATSPPCSRSTAGVAVYTALTRHADTLRAAGDPRGRGQLMADALVERTTGTPGGISGVEIQLVITDRTLFQADAEPARLPGYGTVPAGWARTLINGTRPAHTAVAGRQSPGTQWSPGTRRRGPNTDRNGDGQSGGPPGPAARQPRRAEAPMTPRSPLWLRRLYTHPGTGELIAMDSRARIFPPGLRRFIQTSDDTCRTPYCDAPIRHLDHIIPWHHGGPTTRTNGAGLCEACNHTKETPGWKARPAPTRRPRAHTIELTTPTGHTYHSTAPPLPGTPLRPSATDQPGSQPSPPAPAPAPSQNAQARKAQSGSRSLGIIDCPRRNWRRSGQPARAVRCSCWPLV